MANYIKFEVYIPVEYDKADEHLSVDLDHFEPLFAELSQKYGGCTTHYISGNPPYTGFWKDEADIIVDTLTSVVILVKNRMAREAKKDFTELKQKLEKNLGQSFVLITYYPISLIGTL